ncbi:MAG TPA: hypothetical protein VGJ15_01820 [Pirellulales bacterium]|jgi:hypothetical protein
MSKASSLEDYKQIDAFQSLRTVLNEQFTDRLEKPLAYWALPSDRRLPLAFLGRSLRQLLDSPFESLASTPGIGRKKIDSMLRLLSRAAKQRPAVGQDGAADHDHRPAARNDRPINLDGPFDSAAVSEAHWDQWRETVRRHSLSLLKLGHLAASLQALPTVIWQAPLSNYLEPSLAELRQFKTHGEKRVHAILHVFYSIHQVLGFSQPQSHLTLRMGPKFVVAIEDWILSSVQKPKPPHIDAVRECLAIPLLAQVNVDCGSTIVKLAEGRLGIHATPLSVKQQAKKLGVTRARVYQLLEESGKAMQVRWPEGRTMLMAMHKKLAVHKDAASALELLEGISELFFPDEEETTSRKSEATASEN